MAESELKIVFPHVPKTGGTTLMFHFLKHFGEDRVVILGPHNRVQRFFRDQSQYEELPPETLARVRVIMGHGVDEKSLSILDPDSVRLLVVWRHPVALLRSRYNHKYNELKRRGVDLPSLRFLRLQPKNFITTALLEKFPSLISPSARQTHQRVQSVLQKFHYVFTTEKLDQQSRGMFESLGLPIEMERRRVAERQQELIVDEEIVCRHNQVDLKIFQRCNSVLDRDGSDHNAIGLLHKPRQNALQALIRTAETADGRARMAYDLLIKSLCGELMAEAALARIEADPHTVAISRPDEFRDALALGWESYRDRLKPALLSYSANNLEKWLAQNKKRHVV